MICGMLLGCASLCLLICMGVVFLDVFPSLSVSSMFLLYVLCCAYHFCCNTPLMRIEKLKSATHLQWYSRKKIFKREWL
jgi:hypothetical protein